MSEHEEEEQKGEEGEEEKRTGGREQIDGRKKIGVGERISE